MSATAGEHDPIPSHVLFGVRFHHLGMGGVMDLFQRVIEARRPVQVSFANAQTIAMCWRDKSLREVINRSHYTFADGMSVVWGSRILGVRMPGRIAGPDAMAALCGVAAEKGYRVFLLGATNETLSALKSALEAANPGLNVVGTLAPAMSVRFSPSEMDEMISAVNAAETDILFVGLSFPKQERWIEANLSRIKAPLSLGVGAAFDFLSGRIPRAPAWLQRRGLEWLYRLWCEPKRLWRRYLWGNLIFIALLISHRLRRKLREAGLRGEK